MSADENNIMKDNVFNTDGDSPDLAVEVLADVLEYTVLVDGFPYVRADFISEATKAVALAYAANGEAAGVAASYQIAKILVDLGNARVALGF